MLCLDLHHISRCFPILLFVLLLLHLKTDSVQSSPERKQTAHAHAGDSFQVFFITELEWEGVQLADESPLTSIVPQQRPQRLYERDLLEHTFTLMPSADNTHQSPDMSGTHYHAFRSRQTLANLLQDAPMSDDDSKLLVVKFTWHSGGTTARQDLYPLLVIITPTSTTTEGTQVVSYQIVQKIYMLPVLPTEVSDQAGETSFVSMSLPKLYREQYLGVFFSPGEHDENPLSGTNSALLLTIHYVKLEITSFQYIDLQLSKENLLHSTLTERSRPVQWQVSGPNAILTKKSDTSLRVDWGVMQKSNTAQKKAYLITLSTHVSFQHTIQCGANELVTFSIFYEVLQRTCIKALDFALLLSRSSAGIPWIDEDASIIRRISLEDGVYRELKFDYASVYQKHLGVRLWLDQDAVQKFWDPQKGRDTVPLLNLIRAEVRCEPVYNSVATIPQDALAQEGKVMMKYDLSFFPCLLPSSFQVIPFRNTNLDTFLWALNDTSLRRIDHDTNHANFLVIAPQPPLNKGRTPGQTSIHTATISDVICFGVLRHTRNVAATLSISFEAIIATASQHIVTLSIYAQESPGPNEELIRTLEMKSSTEQVLQLEWGLKEKKPLATQQLNIEVQFQGNFEAPAKSNWTKFILKDIRCTFYIEQTRDSSTSTAIGQIDPSKKLYDGNPSVYDELTSRTPGETLVLPLPPKSRKPVPSLYTYPASTRTPKTVPSYEKTGSSNATTDIAVTSNIPPATLEETTTKVSTIHGHAMDHAPCLPSGTSIHFMNLRSSYSIPSTRCIQLELRPSQENAGAHWSLPQSLEQSEVENALEMLYGIDTLRRHLPVRAIQHAQLFLRHHDQVLEVCFAFDPFVSDWAQTPRATTDPSTLIALSPFAANLLTGMQPSGRHGAHSGLRDEDIVVIVADGARALRVDAAQHTSDGERRVIWVLSALALLFPKSLTNIHLTAMVGSCGCQTYVVRELSSQLGWVFAPLAAITPLLTPGITFEVNALFWNMVLLMYFLIPVIMNTRVQLYKLHRSALWSCFSVYFTNALLTYAITANSYMAYRSLYMMDATFESDFSWYTQVVFPIVTIVCIIAVSLGLWIVTKRAVPPRYVQIPALQNQSMSDPSLLGKYGLGWAPLPQRKLRWKMMLPRGEWMPAVKLQQWAHLGLYEASRVWPSSKYTTIAFLHITGTILSGQSSTFTGCYVQSVVFAALSVLKCLWHLGSRPYRWWWSNLSFSLVLFSNALLALMTFVPHSRECQMCTDVQHWLLGDRALAAYYTFVVVIDVLDGIVSFVLMLSDAYFCISIANRSVSRKDEPADVDLNRELFDVLADSYVPEPMDVLSPTINDSILDRDVAPSLSGIL